MSLVEEAPATQVAELPKYDEFAFQDPALLSDQENVFRRLANRLIVNPWRHLKERPVAVPLKAAAALGGSAVGAAIALGMGSQYYHAEIAGIDTSANISPDLTGRGDVSVFTNAGSIGAKPFDIMPLKVTLSPQLKNMNTIEQIADGPSEYVSTVTCEAQDEITPAVKYFGGLAIGGLFFGGLIGGGIAEFASSRKGERGEDNYPAKLARRAAGRAAVSSVVIVASVGGAMAATYNPDWMQSHTSTGLVAEAEQIPGKVQELAAREKTAAAYAKSAITVFNALGEPAPVESMPKTAYNIAFISDTHDSLESYYLVASMIKEKNIKVVVNTGDETEFGLTQELTPEHIAAIKAITEQGTKMTFNIGNHGNDKIAEQLEKIQGVYVFDDKHKVLDAFGLRIAGAPDPMGAQPEGGTELTTEQNRQLEADAAKQTAEALGNWQWIDIFQTHEPWMADDVAEQLDKIREVAAGHVHEQNALSDIQSKTRDYLRLIEGTSGKGGTILRYIPGGKGNGVMSLSLEGVSSDCQFSQVTRIKVKDQALPFINPDKLKMSFPDGVIAESATIGLKLQKVAEGRQCGADQEIGWINTTDEQALRPSEAGKSLGDAKQPSTPLPRPQVLACRQG